MLICSLWVCQSLSGVCSIVTLATNPLGASKRNCFSSGSFFLIHSQTSFFLAISFSSFFCVRCLACSYSLSSFECIFYYLLKICLCSGDLFCGSRKISGNIAIYPCHHSLYPMIHSLIGEWLCCWISLYLCGYAVC